MTPVLELRNVSKIMGKKVLVEDINFTINKGEIFGFLGPNGAGKTTTIKMITGLYSISKGEIFIDGKSVKKEFEKALSEVGGIIAVSYTHLWGVKILLTLNINFRMPNITTLNSVVKNNRFFTMLFLSVLLSITKQLSSDSAMPTIKKLKICIFSSLYIRTFC